MILLKIENAGRKTREHIMKKIKIIIVFFALFFVGSLYAQSHIEQIKTTLDSIKSEAPGLTKKANINVNNTSLADFLQALATANQVNLNIHPDLQQIIINNNFSNATVADVLVFVCKEYGLAIDFTGNILSIRKDIKPTIIIPHRIIPITYDSEQDLITFDLKNDTLHVVFKQLMQQTGKNLVFAPGMGKLVLSGYIQNMPFDSALDKLAFANNLSSTKTRDHYYLFENNSIIANNQTLQSKETIQQRPQRQRRSNFFFEIDSISKKVTVDFENTAISNIIYDIGHQLDKGMFTASPLDEAGNTSVKTQNISYDHLLDKILENTEYTYKKSDSIYYFGKKDQVSLRDAVLIPLMHRSIEFMTSNSSPNRRAGRTSTVNNQGFGLNSLNNRNNNLNTNRQNINTNNSQTFSERDSKAESLVNMLPEDVIKDLKVSVDIELNSFIVSGPSQNIQRFKKFIAYIDKPVPVILIEVMLLEVNKTATVETGVEWGLGDQPAVTQGGVYPNTDLTLGASTVNRVIGNFNSFGSFNIGQVVPNFFAKIKAMEVNGNVKIRSTPKLSALNGHRANLSIGETTYFAVTQRDIIGSQNPQTSTITNYQPIDAEFAINIKPLVSGDGQITLDINVIQSTFNGNRVADDAPPGVNSREFNSIIRVKDKDVVVLGGLEEKIKNDTGSGVPFLARIPVIKWFFSKRKREDTKKKLTVLIKPTIIK